MKILVLILTVAAIGQSVPVSQDDSVLRLVVGNFVDCMNSDLNLCLKEHALKAAERLGTVRKLDVFDGVTIYNNKPREAKSLDTLSNDVDERKKQVSERLWESANDLFENGEIELSYPESEEKDESRALGDVDEGRGKKKKIKKKLKMLIPFAILAKIKAVSIAVLALVVIAAAVFKLAVLAKIAFFAKIIAIIKSLLSKKKSDGWGDEGGWSGASAYEDHGHGGHGGGWEGGSGWSRSKKDANDLAYSGYSQ